MALLSFRDPNETAFSHIISGQGEGGVPPNRAPLSRYYFLRLRADCMIDSVIPNNTMQMNKNTPIVTTNSMS